MENRQNRSSAQSWSNISISPPAEAIPDPRKSVWNARASSSVAGERCTGVPIGDISKDALPHAKGRNPATTPTPFPWQKDSWSNSSTPATQRFTLQRHVPSAERYRTLPSPTRLPKGACRVATPNSMPIMLPQSLRKGAQSIFICHHPKGVMVPPYFYPPSMCWMRWTKNGFPQPSPSKTSTMATLVATPSKRYPLLQPKPYAPTIPCASSRFATSSRGGLNTKIVHCVSITRKSR